LENRLELVLNEKKIVADIKAGNDNAFNRLMEHYLPYVFSLAIRIVGDEMNADDVTQEVFIRAHKYFHKFRGKSSIKTWLYRITVNQSLKTIKQFKRTYNHTPVEKVNDLRNPSDDPLESTLKDDRQRMLRQLIQQLPEKQRTVVILRIEENLPFKEIAVIMRRTIGTVKANYFHAIQNLKQAFQKGDKI